MMAGRSMAHRNVDDELDILVVVVVLASGDLKTRIWREVFRLRTLAQPRRKCRGAAQGARDCD